MAIGRHTAAAIQNVGGIIGGAMEKKAMLELQDEETRRKEEIRQQERTEDRDWQEKKLEASMQVSAAKDASVERRHGETLAAAKERTMATIAERTKDRTSREKIASERTEKTAEYKPGQEIDDLNAMIRMETEKLSNVYSLKPGEDDEIRAKLSALENRRTAILRKARGEKDPEVPGDIRFDKGLVGSQLVGEGRGALRPGQGDKPPAKGDNAGVRTQEEFDAAYKASKPGDVIRYWDDESGTWKRVRKTGE